MLNSYRKNKTAQNWVLWIIIFLLASYVLVGFGSAPPLATGDEIASLGNTPISVSDARIQQQMIRNRFRGLDRDMADNFAINQLITDAVIIDGADQLGITVSDDELRDYVIRSRNIDDNWIDQEDWEYRIKNGFNVQVETFEEYMREHDLRVNKFRNMFYESAYISENEIRQRFEENNRKVKLEMITLNTFDVKNEVDLSKDANIEKLMADYPDAFMSGPQRQVRFISVSLKALQDNAAEPSDAEITEYYNTNKERYVIKEQVKASHILVKTENHNNSDEETRAIAEKVKAEVDAGGDFAELAKKHSEDEGTKAKGGDLGFFTRERMVQPFAEAAFALEVGQVSDLVKTQFGYHIIKKEAHDEEKTRPLEEVKGSIASIIKRNKARENGTAEAEKFITLVEGGKDFETAANEMGLEVQATPFFDEDRSSNLGDVLNNNFQARRAAFQLAEIDDISTAITLPNMVVVMQYAASQDPQPLSFEDDKARVQKKAEEVAGAAFIKEALASIQEEAEKAPEKALSDLKGKRAYLKDNHFTTTSWVDDKTLPYQLRDNNMTFSDIFAIEKGGFLPSYEGSSETSFVLARVVDKQEPDMSKLDEERHTIIGQIRSEKAGDFMSAYVFARQQEYDNIDDIKARLNQSLRTR